MSQLINASICLSDIPEDKRTKGKNNKWYFNFCISELKEVDKYGNTHTLYCQQTKEEREAKEHKKYVGNAKEVVFNNQQKSKFEVETKTDYSVEPDESAGLPF